MPIMAKRKGISKRARFEVFKRDGFKCQYCGRTPPTVVLHVDHVIAVANGGGNEDTNLVTACCDCNSGKAAVPLTDKPLAVAESLAIAVEKREQLAAYNKFLLAARHADDDTARSIGTYWIDKLTTNKKERGKWTLGDDRITSIKTFIKRLPVSDIYDAVDIALSRKRATRRDYAEAFKYFCGICWTKIKQREAGHDGETP